MLDFPRWKKAWLWLVTAAAALAALPSLFALANLPWPAGVPEPLVNLGLDLAGGSHLLLEAESGQIAAQRLENMEETVRTTMRQASPRIRISEVSTSAETYSSSMSSPSKTASKALSSNPSSSLTARIGSAEVRLVTYSMVAWRG